MTPAPPVGQKRGKVGWTSKGLPVLNNSDMSKSSSLLLLSSPKGHVINRASSLVS